MTGPIVSLELFPQVLIGSSSSPGCVTYLAGEPYQLTTDSLSVILTDDHSLAKWKREAEGWYKQDSAMLEDLLQTVEDNAVRNISPLSFTISMTAILHRRMGMII
jgi:hypothetical protein